MDTQEASGGERNEGEKEKERKEKKKRRCYVRVEARKGQRSHESLRLSFVSLGTLALSGVPFQISSRSRSSHQSVREFLDRARRRATT